METESDDSMKDKEKYNEKGYDRYSYNKKS
jgi:hypothetical protein